MLMFDLITFRPIRTAARCVTFYVSVNQLPSLSFLNSAFSTHAQRSHIGLPHEARSRVDKAFCFTSLRPIT
jgi:hypothetical protein